MQVVLPGICRQTELSLHRTLEVLLKAGPFLRSQWRDKHRQMSEGLMGPTKRPPLVPRDISYYCVEINETGEFGGLGCYSRLSTHHHLYAFIEWALSATFIQSDSHTRKKSSCGLHLPHSNPHDFHQNLTWSVKIWPSLGGVGCQLLSHVSQMPMLTLNGVMIL